MRNLLLLVLTMIGLAAGVQSAPAAAPAPMTPWSRCQNGQPATYTATKWVHGSTYLTAAPLALQAGDVIHLSATGTINTGGWSGSHGPAGSNTITWGGNWPHQGGRAYSLYGRFAGNGVKFLAANTGCMDPAGYHSGGNDRIDLGINDENLSDNTGGFTVTMRVYRNLVQDGGFERQPNRGVSAPWHAEGPDHKGVDIRLGYANSGGNNAFIRTGSRNWNAVTQYVPLRPHASYRMRVFLRTSPVFGAGYLGVRGASTGLVERPYGVVNGYQEHTIDFTTGANGAVTVFLGYWAPGSDSWVQMDDFAIYPA
ncbi:hypothetical protein SAMN04488074_112200 [Lentzea albidocapillata subsp. violacea]|uniref:Carbohydrate binding domain-containing protein n=1 Tax=Lentzea albidocapillata subsp. violacea TaxID=128104 RepID=A0A1G9LVW6_9PSEU|nr:hypothetical protein [Lentzea albidocapillata]SDL66043.1 hypothetical protein SAMN04488074_112200 [Lentzea albidocapillata subsp. violacea]